MDPNATLDRIADLLATEKNLGRDNAHLVWEELRGALDDLDEWIVKGGFDPTVETAEQQEAWATWVGFHNHGITRASRTGGVSARW